MHRKGCDAAAEKIDQIPGGSVVGIGRRKDIDRRDVVLKMRVDLFQDQKLMLIVDRAVQERRDLIGKQGVLAVKDDQFHDLLDHRGVRDVDVDEQDGNAVLIAVGYDLIRKLFDIFVQKAEPGGFCRDQCIQK